MKPTFALTLALFTTSLAGVAAQNPPPLLAQQPALSATHIVFVFAGDLWSVPRQGGAAMRLTTGVGVESNPSFSPDGRWITFTGQSDGNTDVFVMPAEGGVPKRLTWHPDEDIALGWTTDGRKILFSSSRNSSTRTRELYLAGLEGGLEEKLPLPMGWEASYSPDGQRLAYVPTNRAFFAWKRYRGGRTTPIWIAALSNSHIEKVPRDNSNDFCPMWVGDRVYFLSDRSNPVSLFSYDTRTKRVTQAARNDRMDFKSASAGPGAIVIEQFGRIQLYDLKTGQLAPVNITLAGDMAELRPKYVNVARRLTNAHISPTGARALFEARGEILTVPAEKGDTRNLTETPGVIERDPAWSPDGKWIAYFSDESGEYELHLRDSSWTGETRKIRLEDKPTFKKYEPYVESIMSRRDLTYLFADMMGEITVGHLGVGGGDMPGTRNIPTGVLGADYRIENARYRFARIYDGENWNPDLRAPLTQPGVNVQEGEYLLTVNGRDLRATDNVYSFFEATSGRQVRLRVGPNPDGTLARDVTVVPVASETRLRNLAWIEANRRKVDEATSGRVAYVYMPDTAFGGLANFTRYFYAQIGKEAAIIDERFNGGGALATDIIEHLNRRMMSLVATRDGEDEVQPQGAIFGPKVMIINEFAGSGGDAMPNYFRRAGVGKLIGTRTWGGLVGRAGAPPLMDGGFVTAPSSGVWGPDGQWDAENVGISPDIEVAHDPELVRQGKDPQLERAIQEILTELKRNPVRNPKRPTYPDYYKRGQTTGGTR
jgi:Tol biopolymer transport system component/C-terminal processing protease CtpA/Prc